MADDETRPAADAPQPEQPPPGVPHTPIAQATDDEPPPPWQEPAPTGDEGLGGEPTGLAGEPTMASAGADLAAPDRPAETFAARPPEPASPERSKLPGLLAAIGVVVIILLGINLYMMAYPPGRGDIPALQADLDAVKQQVAALAAKPSEATDLAPLDARVKALDTALAQATSGLAETRAKMEAMPVQTQAAINATASRLDALDKRAGSIEGGFAALKTDVAALKTDAAALKTDVAAIPKVDLGPVQARIVDLQTGVDSLKAGLAAVPKVDLGPLETGQAALDGRLKPLESEYARTRTRAAPLALTAQSIILDLDEGKPFGPEVAALQALGVDDAKLSALRPLASTGAPTKAELVAGFAAVRRATVEADAPQVTGTVLDRMVASAQSVVKVRAAGASPGNDSDAIGSRIAADLDAGAFAAALAEWNGLPAAGKAASSAWADKLKQRVAAEDAARSIASAAVATLGSPQ